MCIGIYRYVICRCCSIVHFFFSLNLKLKMPCDRAFMWIIIAWWWWWKMNRKNSHWIQSSNAIRRWFIQFYWKIRDQIKWERKLWLKREKSIQINKPNEHTYTRLNEIKACAISFIFFIVTITHIWIWCISIYGEMTTMPWQQSYLGTEAWGGKNEWMRITRSVSEREREWERA